MEKLWYSLMALVFALVISYGIYSGVRIGCDGPPLKEGASIVIGKPCGSEPEPEKAVVYREVYQPIISVEAVKLLGLLPIPISLIAIGSALAVRALWGAKWQ